MGLEKQYGCHHWQVYRRLWGRPIFVDTATLWEAVSEGEHPGETGGSEATQGTQPVELMWSIPRIGQMCKRESRTRDTINA